MDYCKLAVDSLLIGIGSVTVGYGIVRGIKKIRASFKDAAGEAQASGKNVETAQPNYWVNHVDRAVLPPKKSHRPDSQPTTPDSAPKAAPAS